MRRMLTSPCASAERTARPIVASAFRAEMSTVNGTSDTDHASDRDVALPLPVSARELDLPALQLREVRDDDELRPFRNRRRVGRRHERPAMKRGYAAIRSRAPPVPLDHHRDPRPKAGMAPANVFELRHDRSPELGETP